MDAKKTFDAADSLQAQIKDLFKRLATTEPLDAWVDTFEIQIIDNKRIVIIYSGTENIKVFKKKCKLAISSAIYSIVGDVKSIKIVNASNYTPQKTQKKTDALRFFILGTVFIGIAAAVILVLFNYIGNRNFRETFYNTSSIKVDSRIRVVQVSDLHGATYGSNNRQLLERIDALEPDIIICTGDIVDSVSDDINYALNLAEELSKIAPSYYVYGNHETEDIYGIPLDRNDLDKKFGFDESNRDQTALSKIQDSFEEQLENAGIKVLKNEKDTIKVNNITVDVYGVLTSNPSAFWPYSGTAFADYIYENTDHLKITAVHEPYLFEESMSDVWGDLIVCGHTHGGIARVPILGPLYTLEGGLFPERNGCFVYGRYDTEGTPLIVSSGLDNSSIYRINNQPELVIIDINKF